MAPLFILIIVWTVLRVVGWLAGGSLSSWRSSGRFALAAMFIFTGVTHFSSMSTDYLAMIPGPFPRGLWVIYLTGALEILGAMGLLIPKLHRVAGACLVILLLVLFPANVYAWVAEIPFNGRPATSLWIRGPIQLSFLAALWFTAVRSDKG